LESSPEITIARGSTPEPGSDSENRAANGSKKQRSVLAMNIRGLNSNCDKTKPKQLGDIAEAENAVIIAITETWLNENHEDGLKSQVSTSLGLTGKSRQEEEPVSMYEKT
jgi:hypothetical protein